MKRFQEWYKERIQQEGSFDDTTQFDASTGTGGWKSQRGATPGSGATLRSIYQGISNLPPIDQEKAAETRKKWNDLDREQQEWLLKKLRCRKCGAECKPICHLDQKTGELNKFARCPKCTFTDDVEEIQQSQPQHNFLQRVAALFM